MCNRQNIIVQYSFMHRCKLKWEQCLYLCTVSIEYIYFQVIFQKVIASELINEILKRISYRSGYATGSNKKFLMSFP